MVYEPFSADALVVAQQNGGNPLSLLIIIVPVAIIVWLVVKAPNPIGSKREAPSRPIPQNCVIAGEPEQILNDLQLILSGERNTVVRRSTSDSLSIDRTTIPTWAVVLAVLTFPIGLLFLLAKNTTTGTLIAAETAHGQTTLRTAGDFSSSVNYQLRVFIDARSDSASGQRSADAGEQEDYRPPPPTHRPCPYCAEDIKMQAIVCRFCGRDVDPLGPPPFTGTFAEPSSAEPASTHESESDGAPDSWHGKFADPSGRMWASDPTGRYRYRSFDDGEWTTLVRNTRTGVVSSDPEGLDWIAADD